MSGSDEPDWSEEQTDNPLLADDRNFYKLEKWTKDGTPWQAPCTRTIVAMSSLFVAPSPRRAVCCPRRALFAPPGQRAAGGSRLDS